MYDRKLNILSTSELQQEQLDKLTAHKMDVDVVPMISIVPMEQGQLEGQLKERFGQKLTVVFTSAKAVHIVASAANGRKPEWGIYCIGKATAEAVQEYFGPETIIATAYNAAPLAEEIVKNSCKSVVFFCGDKHRDELPDKLRDTNIAVDEVIVYNTIATPAALSKVYDAILFFSPSGIAGYIIKNDFAPQTVLFAIGNTTGDALKMITSNKVIVSDIPARDNMTDLVINYFKWLQ